MTTIRKIVPSETTLQARLTRLEAEHADNSRRLAALKEDEAARKIARDGDALDELERLADGVVSKFPKLTREAAMVEAIGSRPDLYAQFEAARRAGQLRRREPSPPPEPSRRAQARQVLWDRILERAEDTVAKGAMTDEQHLARYLQSDEGKRAYETYCRT
jgi:hypothetical protein